MSGGPFCVICQKLPIDGPAVCARCRRVLAKKVRGWDGDDRDVDIVDLICAVARETRAHGRGHRVKAKGKRS